jgi:hypothetical protein
VGQKLVFGEYGHVSTLIKTALPGGRARIRTSHYRRLLTGTARALNTISAPEKASARIGRDYRISAPPGHA